jgi:hypothetical protein
MHVPLFITHSYMEFTNDELTTLNTFLNGVADLPADVIAINAEIAAYLATVVPPAPAEPTQFEHVVTQQDLDEDPNFAGNGYTVGETVNIDPTA